MTAAAAFSGSIPEHYERYLVPVLFEPYAADLVARLRMRDGMRVLELACGTGVVTRRLRAQLPSSATLTATDLSPAMLALAAQRVPAPDISWQRADAQALPFDDGAFDAVLCQFGWMFLPDKARAFAEARRVLAPGGQLLVNVWDSVAANPYAAEMAAALARLFPTDPPRFVEMVHGYFDPAQITADLRAAGWTDATNATLTRVAKHGHARSAGELAAGFAYGSPVHQLLVDRGADPEAFVREVTPGMVAVGGATSFAPALGAIVIAATRD